MVDDTQGQAAQPNQSGADAIQRILRAASDGDAAAVARLLQENPALADAQGTHPYWEGDTWRPLHIAADRGNVEIAKMLLEQGADPNSRDGLTGWAPLHFAVTSGQPEFVQLLVAHGVQVDIFAAAGMDDVERVRALLAGDPAVVHAKGPDGATPLHFAKSVEVARLLLEQGADINARDEFHQLTPLRWTEYTSEVAGFLLAQGAEVPDIFTACTFGLLDRAQALLQADPALVNARTPEADFYGGGATPLHIAARNGQAEIARLLMERGADVNARGGWLNVVPLHWAAQHGHAEIIKLLLQHGADPNARDSEHDSTPLGWAEFFNQQAAMEVLRGTNQPQNHSAPGN